MRGLERLWIIGKFKKVLPILYLQNIRINLAICWNNRLVSGATWKSNNASGAVNQQERFTQVKILRDYMPNLAQASEDIVRTLWRHKERNRNVFANVKVVTKLSAIPFRVSSEAHERRNDWGTVSAASSVKMRFPWRRGIPVAGRKDPGSFTAAWYWF